MREEGPRGPARLARSLHPIALLVGCLLLAAVLSHLLPAGEYERREDPASGRSVVVPGTYERVEPQPLSLMDALLAIPRGLADAADVVFLVFLVGGAFTVVDRTGALNAGVRWLVGRLGGRELLVVPAVSLFFAAGGALENMQEEIIALVPLLLVLTRRLGYTPLTAVAMSAGPAFVGSSFSPINPFQVGIAQKLAELPLLSGSVFRLVLMGAALVFWIGTTMRHATRTGGEPRTVDAEREDAPVSVRDGAILALIGLAFALLVYGLVRLGWGFDHLSALFFGVGAVAGLVGRLGVRGTADAYVDGFRSMAFAALLVGFARGIYVALEDGRIVDTVVHGIFTPIADLPVALSALGMLVAHVAVHVPVPSVSGHAVLTIPLLVPLSDLLGLSRQVAVLAYQYGAGLCDLLTPTNGALLAILAAAGVGYDEWLRFALPRWLVLLGLAAAGLLAAMAIGLS